MIFMQPAVFGVLRSARVLLYSLEARDSRCINNKTKKLRQKSRLNGKRTIKSFVSVAWGGCRRPLPSCNQKNGNENFVGVLCRNGAHPLGTHLFINPRPRVRIHVNDASK